jgi:hypothetical protein
MPNKYIDMTEAQDAMAEVIRASRAGVSDAELAMHIADTFGGMAGMANEFKLTFDATPQGSKNRITMLGQAMKLIESVSARQEQHSQTQTLEECQAALAEELRRLQEDA